MSKKPTKVSGEKKEVSKNSVRSVSRKLLNSLARERRNNPDIATLIARDNAHELIRSKGTGAAKKNLEIREKAKNLVDTYSEIGVTYAKVVHAVKTNKVEQMLSRNKTR